MKYLLDTCVISELVSKQPHPAVVKWVDSLEEELTYLSAITVGEIKRGIEKLPASRRKQELDQWLTADLLERFRGRILAIDTYTMLAWGELTAQLEKSGRKLPTIDSLVAALALRYDLRLATRNEKDFEGTGVPTINPWPRP